MSIRCGVVLNRNRPRGMFGDALGHARRGETAQKRRHFWSTDMYILLSGKKAKGIEIWVMRSGNDESDELRWFHEPLAPLRAIVLCTASAASSPFVLFVQELFGYFQRKNSLL